MTSLIKREGDMRKDKVFAECSPSPHYSNWAGVSAFDPVPVSSDIWVVCQEKGKWPQLVENFSLHHSPAKSDINFTVSVSN